MKKFNVPTKLDLILQLITSEKHKPRFTRRRSYIKVYVKRAGGHICLIYDLRDGYLRVCIVLHAPLGFMNEHITRWDRIYAWAKRVDSNRHNWCK